jgi:hypothetical protein
MVWGCTGRARFLALWFLALVLSVAALTLYLALG